MTIISSHGKEKFIRVDSISEVKMLARVLVALAATSVAAEKVKIGEIQTLHHAVKIEHKLTKNKKCQEISNIELKKGKSKHCTMQ